MLASGPELSLSYIAASVVIAFPLCDIYTRFPFSLSDSSHWHRTISPRVPLYTWTRPHAIDTHTRGGTGLLSFLFLLGSRVCLTASVVK